MGRHDADDLRLTPRIMQLNAELLARDRNHPSVFIWSRLQRKRLRLGFERSHEWMRRADPSRPNAGSYAAARLNCWPGTTPSLSRHRRAEKVDKPVLWDECWCIFQGIFGDVAEMWLDPGIRDYYAEPLPAIYERMMRAENIAGTQIWAWSDDIFCVPNRGLEYGRGTTRSHFIENQYRLPGRGLVGDAPWGVVDGWRRKKPEFWITKKLHSPVKLKEGPIALPPARPSASRSRTNTTSPIYPSCMWSGKSTVSEASRRRPGCRIRRVRSKSGRAIRWRLGKSWTSISWTARPPSGCLQVSFGQGRRSNASPAQPGA